MRWIGSLVADIQPYPDPRRRVPLSGRCAEGLREGRLRLLYEAHPIALIMEWAGGAASTGPTASSMYRHDGRISGCRWSWDRRARCATSMSTY
jgi:hypothetical protein